LIVRLPAKECTSRVQDGKQTPLVDLCPTTLEGRPGPLGQRVVNTVLKLFAETGQACVNCQDRMFRSLNCRRLQLDETWSFVYTKALYVPTAKNAPDGARDVWT
jgi:hypothetical protein